ncbi:MAG: ABC transporter substrate-binding protein [Sulfurimonas sp.]|nr:ABC transporter substrate-binding protein [Sulfurimonas sp.]
MKIILFFILFTSSLFGSLEKISIQLEWKHQFQFAGYYVAKEKGYYRDIGLDVEIKEFTSNINIIDDILNQKSTFGVLSSSTILSKLQGKPLVLVASYFKQNALVLATIPSIKNISNLKNKKIMLNSKHIETTSIGAMLKKNNLNKSDYINIKHDYNLDKFINGEVDAISIFISNQPYLLDKLNIKYNILNPSTEGIYSFDGELFTSKKIANNSIHMVDAFAKATNKGWEYALKHKEEIVELIYNKYSNNKSKGALLYEAKKIEYLFNTDIFKIGAVVPALIKMNVQMYINLGLIDKNIDISQSLSEYFLEDIKKKKNINFQYIPNFNAKEQKYLKNKKQITACINPDWMPFESFYKNEHIGITNDYFKLFQKKMNIPIKVIKTKTWEESIKLIKNRECDIVSIIKETKKRKKYLNFSTTYLTSPLVIVTKSNIAHISKINDIKTKLIAIKKGYVFNDIKKIYPKLKIINVKNTKDGLQKVKNNEVFAYIGTLTSISYLFQKEFVGDLKISGKFDKLFELKLGIRNDDPQLLNIFEKVLNKISETEKQNILNKWVAIKYENGTDYTLIWQILFIFILIISVTIYWNRRLSLLNIELIDARKKAEEATLTKSNFLANISHEIRTPMNSIVNMAYLSKNKAVDSTQLKYLEAIEKASNNLLLTLNNILDFSKVEANKLELNKVKFTLSKVLDDVNDVMKPKIFEKDLDFSIIYDESVFVNFHGDDFKLTQILINLISNAVKFTDKGYINLYINQTSEKKIRFSICDTGIGITKKQINKIFLPFTQADSSITRKYGGTGLGLSITKELVELMDGKIWIESKINIGSKFIFEIELEKKYTLSKKKIALDLKQYKKIIFQKKVLDDKIKDELFLKLKSAIISRRPYICKPIIDKIDEYRLNNEDKKLFLKIKNLLNKYKFDEARELL